MKILKTYLPETVELESFADWQKLAHDFCYRGWTIIEGKPAITPRANSAYPQQINLDYDLSLKTLTLF